MRLAAFIRANMNPIMREWENFALTLISQSHSATPLALHDHIQELLDFIADDIQSPQTKSEQKQKSHGKKSPDVKDSAAEIHASIRLSGGFDMNQMVSEYRSLRASVIRLWETQNDVLKTHDLTDLIRFNEAIDQQITESIKHYTKKLDHSRDLFIGILSHDLYNPLGAARMSGELLLRIGKLEERESMLATQIVDSASRALEIVSHLRDLTLARLVEAHKGVISVTSSEKDGTLFTARFPRTASSVLSSCTFGEPLLVLASSQSIWDIPRLSLSVSCFKAFFDVHNRSFG